MYFSKKTLLTQKQKRVLVGSTIAPHLRRKFCDCAASSTPCTRVNSHHQSYGCCSMIGYSFATEVTRTAGSSKCTGKSKVCTTLIKLILGHTKKETRGDTVVIVRTDNNLLFTTNYTSPVYDRFLFFIQRCPLLKGKRFCQDAATTSPTTHGKLPVSKSTNPLHVYTVGLSCTKVCALF